MEGRFALVRENCKLFRRFVFPAALRYCTECAIPGNFRCYLPLFFENCLLPVLPEKSGEKDVRNFETLSSFKLFRSRAKRPFDPSSWQHILHSKKAGVRFYTRCFWPLCRKVKISCEVRTYSDLQKSFFCRKYSKFLRSHSLISRWNFSSHNCWKEEKGEKIPPYWTGFLTCCHFFPSSCCVSPSH